MLFINFRVGDGEDKAAWLDAELNVVFGKERVFRSSRSIDLGHDYEPIMWGAVENCSAMIVVIGDRWMSEFGARLFEPDDVVRKEIATALAAGKPVIPVLGQTGRMFRADELPPDLAKLAACQYVRLTYRDPHMLPGLVERLIDAVPDLGIGVREGIGDLAGWDRERTSSTGSVLPPDLVLLGRGEIAEKVRSWLSGTPGNLVICGQTTDEVAAFAAAVLREHDPRHRAVLVSSKAGWEHTARIPQSLVAVVVSDDVPVSHAQSDRHVIIARDRLAHRAGELLLPPTPRDTARDAFMALDVPLHLADEYAGLARRSPRALIRRLTPNHPRPQWTQSPDSDVAVPLVLVSRWAMANEADHGVVARITGHDYARVERFAESSANSGDPFVHRSGSRWQLADPYDATTQLMAQVTATDLQRFRDAAIEVLGEVDPVLSLPDPEVPSAGIRGVSRAWSDELRQGIAHGLARLGDAGPTRMANDTAENHAGRVVHELLKQANEDRTGLRWRSLGDVLPLLAEAAPRVFLDAVGTGLRGDAPVLRLMFEDATGRSLHRHSAHTGLLWALEGLTWAPEHQIVATLQLARLAELDPGGQFANRPAQSLTNLLTDRPVSPIPLVRRPVIVDQVRTRHPEVGWRLLEDLTHPAPFLMFPERPRVRHDWTGAGSAPTDSVATYRDDVFGAVLAELTGEPRRWPGYLSRITSLPATCRDRLLTALETTDLTPLGPDGLRDLWDQGTAVVNQERADPDGPRFLLEAEVDRLATFVASIEPVTDPTRHAWLFGWHPMLPGIDPTDLDTHRPAVDALRREVVTEELNRHGVDGLAALADASVLGDRVGHTLAQVAGDSVRDEMFSRLTTPLAAGWVRLRAFDGGRDWAAGVVDALPDEPAARTAFLLELPVDWVLDVLAAEPEEVRERFWLSTPAFSFPAGREEEYLAEILGRGRSEAVVDALSRSLHGNAPSWRPPADLVTAALHGLANTPGQVTSHTAYAVGRLLTHLHRTGHDLGEVAMFEITFNGLFHDRQPHALLEMITADPAAFVGMHRFRYLPTGKPNPKAFGFYWTAEHLRCGPGQEGDRVDRARLLGWVREARRLLDEAGLRKSGDQAIGALISAGPVGEDGAWPTEAVRDVLELEDAEDLRTGFGIGVANNSSFTSRGVYDGGRQERESAAEYEAWADAIELSWPHAALTLRDHAESLRGQGTFWDRRAEDDHDE